MDDVVGRAGLVHRTLHARCKRVPSRAEGQANLQGIRRTPPRITKPSLYQFRRWLALFLPPSLVPSVGLNVLLSWVLDIECLVAPNLKRPVHYVRSVRRRPDNLLLCIVQYSKYTYPSRLPSGTINQTSS